MQRKRGELGPIGEALADLSGPLQARHHFTRFDQVDQLVGASEANPERGFMARMMTLCSLPRTNPGNRIRARHEGPKLRERGTIQTADERASCRLYLSTY